MKRAPEILPEALKAGLVERLSTLIAFSDYPTTAASLRIVAFTLERAPHSWKAFQRNGTIAKVHGFLSFPDVGIAHAAAAAHATFEEVQLASTNLSSLHQQRMYMV